MIERPWSKMLNASINVISGGDNNNTYGWVWVGGVGIGEDGATVFVKELPNIYTENKTNICVNRSIINS